MSTEQKRNWGKTDDTELLGYFESGEVDPKNQGKEYIESTRDKYFSWCLYRNFAQTYRKKSDQYNLNGTLTGARSEAAKAGK
jgi:hypothetical protein